MLDRRTDDRAGAVPAAIVRRASPDSAARALDAARHLARGAAAALGHAQAVDRRGRPGSHAYVRLATRAAEEQDSERPQYLVPPQLDLLLKFWADRNPPMAWAVRHHKGYERAKAFLDESEKTSGATASRRKRIGEAEEARRNRRWPMRSPSAHAPKARLRRIGRSPARSSSVAAWHYRQRVGSRETARSAPDRGEAGERSREPISRRDCSSPPKWHGGGRMSSRVKSFSRHLLIAPTPKEVGLGDRTRQGRHLRGDLSLRTSSSMRWRAIDFEPSSSPPARSASACH